MIKKKKKTAAEKEQEKQGMLFPGSFWARPTFVPRH